MDADRQIHRQIDGQAFRQKDRHAGQISRLGETDAQDIETDSQTDGYANRHKDRQKPDRQKTSRQVEMDRQTDPETDVKTAKPTDTCALVYSNATIYNPG